MANALPSCRSSPAATKADGEEEWSAKEENVDDSEVIFEAEVLKLRDQWELASVLNFLNVSLYTGLKFHIS